MNVHLDSSPVKSSAKKPDFRLLPLSEIRVGDRVRKDLGDLDELAASIAELGPLQPIGVDPDLTLIFGERRLRAYEKLGWEEAPAIVFDNLDEAVEAAKAERAENHCRKSFTPSEMVAIGRKLEALERVRAKDRQTAGANQHTEPSGYSPEGSPGDTRDKVGKALGVSGSKFEHAKAVVDAAEDEPEKFGDLVERMDETGKVDPAYQEMKRRKSSASPWLLESIQHLEAIAKICNTADAEFQAALNPNRGPIPQIVAQALQAEGFDIDETPGVGLHDQNRMSYRVSVATDMRNRIQGVIARLNGQLCS